MRRRKSNPGLFFRVAAVFCVLTCALGAQAASLRRFVHAEGLAGFNIAGGPPWMSRWFWLGSTALAVLVAWRVNERSHRRREGLLRLAVAERTQDLDRERLRERERNQILEMLVANEPLGTVLDAVTRLIRAECPKAWCAILLKRGDGCQVAAAAGLSREWLLALRIPHAVPFEVWRKSLLGQQPARDPAWKIFATNMAASLPGVVCSRPIGSPEASLGAILLYYPDGTGHSESDARTLDVGERLARVAMEHTRLYDDLHFQAHHDALTSLPNRSLFEERLERALREAEVLSQSLAVLFVDLDRFKQVNDTLSHRVGDLFLCAIATRMKETLRPGDTVARIGGDEFMIILNDVRDGKEAGEIAARVLEAIRQPVVIDEHHIPASASIGIAIFPDDGMDAEKLQRAADAALYCAKDLGRDRIEEFATRNDTLDRVRMDEELRLALRHGYFVVHYQPKVGQDRKLVGFEALVRMNHPRLGQIPPAAFIPIAETSGLIIPLGNWVLEEVCRQVAEWNSRGLGSVAVAVNVSPVQICLPDFADSVAACLLRYGVPASSLELELTESLLISAAEVAQTQLRKLRALGVKLSIDDFGTGYSSLSYLHRLQVDAIKLDKSFVQSIDTDHIAHKLVIAMIGVAHGLGLSVVAEGVETESQRDVLLAAGCPLMQGFLFARPQLAVDLEELLRIDQRGVAPVPELAAGTRGSSSHSSELLQLTTSMQPSGDLAPQAAPV
jgi:diguanylate cyclase (GGDEF)-like protein